MRERGYNQSKLLAKMIATECDLELNSGVFKRTVKTAPQVSFRNLEERDGAICQQFHHFHYASLLCIGKGSSL